MADLTLNIGLDLGAISIKAVELETNKSGFTLLRLAEKPLGGDSTENGDIKDFGEMVNGISDIMVAGNFSHKSVAVALKGPSVLLKKVSLVTEDLNELEENFRWFADQYIAVDPEEMVIDYEVVQNSQMYNYISLLVTAAHKETVTDFVSVIESAAAIPRVLEPEALSLSRLYRCTGRNIIDISMVLHIGAVGSLVIFMRNGFFDYCREIPVGGRYCTKLIMDRFSISEKLAEKYKMSPTDFDQVNELSDLLTDGFAKDLISNVESILKLYKLKKGSDPVSIFLSGGGASTYGLQQTINDHFKLPTHFLDPWQTITVAETVAPGAINIGNRYSFNVALGLALHGKVY